MTFKVKEQDAVNESATDVQDTSIAGQEVEVKPNTIGSIVGRPAQSLETMLAEKDFISLLPELNATEFGLNMHKSLHSDTLIVRNEQAQFDMTEINNVLIRYPSNYSWAMTQDALISQKADRLEDEYNDWYMLTYSDVAANMKGKATIDLIKAEIVKVHGEELRRRREELRELKTKANIAKSMVKVWATAISALQSLSKNINAEIMMLKNGLES